MTREEAAKEIRKRHCTENKFCHDECMYSENACPYDMAIEALKEPERKWIPVSERLPENYKEVLVEWEKTNSVKNLVVVFISVGFIDEHGEWCNAYRSGFLYENAIAWQPLPEPYKAGEQE